MSTPSAPIELSLAELANVNGGETCAQQGYPGWTAQGARTLGMPITGFATRQACREWVRANAP
jgi:hypothetical protein